MGRNGVLRRTSDVGVGSLLCTDGNGYKFYAHISPPDVIPFIGHLRASESLRFIEPLGYSSVHKKQRCST